MLEENSQVENQFSIFNTFLWMLFLTFGIQMLLGFIAAVGFRALNISDNDLFMRPDTIAITGVIAAILTFPLIRKAAHQSNKLFPYKFLAFQPLNITLLAKVFLVGIAYYILQSMAGSLLSIDTLQFMLDVKSQTHSTFDVMLLVLGICIVAPVVEEVIFRGLAYGRLVKSRAGVTGAIIITSFVFTAIHVQYDFKVLVILLFFSFLLGYVRYKTENLVYCIVLHMQLNTLSTIELFLFL